VSRFHEELNAQIGREFGASQQYVAIAVHYDAETLPGLAAHFYRQALEERNHAMMIVQYLLDADAPVVVPGVEAPRSDFTDALARLAREEGDLVGEQFLHWFLQEQREEVASMSALLAVVERARDNLLLVEDYLSRHGGADEAAIEATAPPAAGGAL
jgi:bacterioferritin B